MNGTVELEALVGGVVEPSARPLGCGTVQRVVLHVSIGHMRHPAGGGGFEPRVRGPSVGLSRGSLTLLQHMRPHHSIVMSPPPPHPSGSGFLRDRPSLPLFLCVLRYSAIQYSPIFHIAVAHLLDVCNCYFLVSFWTNHGPPTTSDREAATGL